MDPLVPKKPNNILSYLQYVILIGLVLYIGQALFIPLTFAVLISFVLYPVCKWLEAKRLPRSLAILVILIILTLIITGLVLMLIGQFQQFSNEWPSLKVKLSALITGISNYLSSHLDLPVKTQVEWIKGVLTNSIPQLFSVIPRFLYSSALGLVFLVLIPFFTALILYHREHFTKCLLALFPSSDKENIFDILRETVITFYNFIKGMAIVYLIVGILNILALLLLGIPHAVLFGIIVSLLTFIPYIGITIGSLLPVTMAWITYDSVLYPTGVILAFTFIQYIEANIIFPLAVSNRLNINTLVMIIAIGIGGIIWGTAGMILFVPFVAILKLIADKVEGWKTISLILGAERRH